MASLRTGASDSAHADPRAVERRPGAASTLRRAAGDSEMLGKLWGQLAVADLYGCREPALVAGRTKRLLDGVERDLLTLWTGPEANPRAVLRLAVVSLECGARVWQAFGPAAGDRRPHLLGSLDQLLADARRQSRAAELPSLISRSMVARAASGARVAVDDLRRGDIDRVEALQALEHAVLALASLAVRIAERPQRIGQGWRARAPYPAALARQLDALACEVSSAAKERRASSVGDGEKDRLGAELRDALGLVCSVEPLLRACEPRGDRSLRAEALLALRARGLELAVGLWLIAQELDHLLTPDCAAGGQWRTSTVSRRAAGALLSTALREHPDEFDHRHAWESHRDALHELVSCVCEALHTREPHSVLRGQQFAVRRIVRVLAAVWAIDRRLATGEADQPCR